MNNPTSGSVLFEDPVASCEDVTAMIPGNMSTKEMSDFYWRVIGRYDFYSGAVNRKAALLSAFNTVIFSAIILKHDQVIATIPNPLMIISVYLSLFVTVVSALYSLGQIFAAVTSFSTKVNSDLGDAKSLIFFDHVASFRTPDEFRNAVLKRSADAFFEDLISQCYFMAKGLNTKFQHMKRGTLAIQYVELPALALTLLIVLSSQLLHG